VIPLIEATREEPRAELVGDENPFRFLERPLRAAVEQLGAEYRRQMTEQTQDDFLRRLSHLLGRDDVMDADFDVWSALHTWKQQAPPTSMLQRTRVVDAVRAIRQLKANAPLEVVIERLRALWDGLQAEGLDRPIVRPPSREPSERDLELVAWELVVTPEMVQSELPDPALWGEPEMAAQLAFEAAALAPGTTRS
jgi:hypothetical protein